MQCLESHAFSGFPNPDKPGSDWCFFFGNGLSSLIVPFTFFCWSSHVTSSINQKTIIRTYQKHRQCVQREPKNTSEPN